MAFAIHFSSTSEPSKFARIFWQAIEQEGVSSFLSQGPYPPYLTLTIYGYLDIAAAQEKLIALAQRSAPFSLSFPVTATFPGNEAVVFLAATMT